MASKKNKAKQKTKAKQKASAKQKNRAKQNKSNKAKELNQSLQKEKHRNSILSSLSYDDKTSYANSVNSAKSVNSAELDLLEEKIVKKIIDNHFANIIRFDDVEELLAYADEDDYQSEVVHTMIERHLTKEEAAQICGVSEETIEQWLQDNLFVGLTPDVVVKRLLIEFKAINKIMPVTDDPSWLHSIMDNTLFTQLAKSAIKNGSKNADDILPYAFERDFSYETMVKLRGSEETPKVDHIPPYEALLYTFDHWCVDETEFNPKTSKYKFTELRRFKNYPIEDWVLETDKIRYFHPKTAELFWIYADQEESLLNPESEFINQSVEENGSKGNSQIKLGSDKSEEDENDKSAEDKAEDKDTEQIVKNQIDEYFSSITRYDDLEDLLTNANEMSYQSEVINTMIERHLTFEEAMEICGVTREDIDEWLLAHPLAGLTPDIAFKRFNLEKTLLDENIESIGDMLAYNSQISAKLRESLIIKAILETGIQASLVIPFSVDRDFSYETQVEKRGSSETPKIDHIPPYIAFSYAREHWGKEEFQFNLESSEIDFAELRRFKKYPVAAWNDEPEKIRYFHPKTGHIYWIYADQEASLLNPEPEVNNKTRAKKATKTAAKTTAKTTKSTAKSNTKSEDKSSTGSTAKKATKSASKSTSKSASKSKSTSKSVVKLVKLTPKTPSEPKTKSSTKSETKSTTKSATKSSTKSATKSATKPATKPTTKSSTKSAIKSTTKSSTKKISGLKIY